MCESWFHLNCVDVSKKECSLFEELGEKAKWFCNKCDVEVKQLIKLKNNGPVNNQISSQEPTLQSILDEVSRIRINFETLDNRVLAVEKICSVPTISHITNMNMPEAVSAALNMHNVVDDRVNTIDKVVDDGFDRSIARSTTTEAVLDVDIEKPVLQVQDGGSGVTISNAQLYSDKVKSRTVMTKQNVNLNSGNSLKVNDNLKKPQRDIKTNDVRQESEIQVPSKKGIIRVVGSGTSSMSRLEPATKKQWLFISRLSVGTECSKLTEHLKSVAKEEVICEELPTRFPGYKSFKVGVCEEDVPSLLKSEFWPQGVLVSEFKPPFKSGRRNYFLGRRRSFQIMT